MKKRKMNGIDILIILVVIGLFVGLAYKMTMGKKQSEIVQEAYETMAVTFKTESLRMASIDAFEIGGQLVDKKTGVVLGEIIKKEKQPSTKTLIKNDGEVVQAEKPLRYDLYLTIASPVVEKSTGYYANGQVDLKRASKMNVCGQKVEIEAKVYDIAPLEK